jgi:hypothetical protein
MADWARWQQQAAAELAAILAAHPDLPAISWTITPGGGLTGQALAPGDPRGTRELFTTWRQALGLEDARETTTGNGASYARAHAMRGPIRITVTALCASPAATGNPGRPGSHADHAPGASRPAFDVTAARPRPNPAPPPGPAGPSPA